MMCKYLVCGFMGAGKTTFGRVLAEELGLKFADTDELVVRKMGCSIPEIFNNEGELHFRDLEHECLKVALNSAQVVSVGGGTFDFERNMLLFSTSFDIIFLDAEFGICYNRIKHTDRPILKSSTVEQLKSLFWDRRRRFEKFANLILKPYNRKNLEGDFELMISAGDFRNGVTFELDGNVFQVIEFQHVKPGKGAAFVRTKIKNVITGGVVERTFNPSDKFPPAFVERKDMQYLYQEGDLYYFMDNESFETVPINGSILEDNFKFAKENMEMKVMSFKGNVFGVELPYFVELEVTQTEPGVKGDTATNVTKNAVLETGAEIKVPMFINEGDRVRIDTRTGSYMERA